MMKRPLSCKEQHLAFLDEQYIKCTQTTNLFALLMTEFSLSFEDAKDIFAYWAGRL